ncbi:hypothetical protein UFOVP580_23 [uncultured Caudovirales phage]|uniref:Uncharacterized protein n=1 Tax=uncultured Caudovirales phage TaxID=2100421 RepID=A0A6J5PM53_9CAUD|nr:hypothetical protein UFOVP580_23 [uncultured Caudovirales phage]
MTQSIVALELLRRTAVLIGAIPAGAQLSSQDSNDMLTTLNEMLDSWSTESLAVYGQANIEFPIVGGKAVYTWGAGADWDSPRPVRIEDMSFIYGGDNYHLREMIQQEYNQMLDKSLTGLIPERWMLTNSFPNAEVTFYPVPSNNGTANIQAYRVLTNISSLTTQVYLPPGYLRAIRYCLAVELWPEYPNPQIDINTIKAISLRAKANIKIANQTDELISFESIPGVASYGSAFDWRVG